jgi:hypothetical protein
VSTIIFLPVSPVSPCGPPITNFPVGLIKYSILSLNKFLFSSSSLLDDNYLFKYIISLLYFFGTGMNLLYLDNKGSYKLFNLKNLFFSLFNIFSYYSFNSLSVFSFISDNFISLSIQELDNLFLNNNILKGENNSLLKNNKKISIDNEIKLSEIKEKTERELKE